MRIAKKYQVTHEETYPITDELIREFAFWAEEDFLTFDENDLMDTCEYLFETAEEASVYLSEFALWKGSCL